MRHDAPADASPWGALRPSRTASFCIGLVRHGIARGALRRPLYKLLAGLGPFYDVKVDGLSFRLRINDNWTETGLLVYGPRRLGEIQQIVGRLTPGDTFVDLGANSGIFTSYAAQAVGSGGRVLAVEPTPELVNRLRFNVAANGFRNVQIAPVAVGDRSGEATLNVVAIQHGRSSLLPVRDGDKQVSVVMEPLLSLLIAHGIDRIDAMKVDIEGYEDRALLPFYEQAPAGLWPRHLLIEKLGQGVRWQQDCLAELAKLGYATTWEGKDDVLLELRARPGAASSHRVRA